MTREELEAAKAAALAEVAAEYDAKIAALDVDPLLIEAREICADHWERRGIFYFAAKIREGVCDNNFDVDSALAALRRGMELAAAPQPSPVSAPLDAEPDWGPAVKRFADAAGFECGNLPEVLESIRVGLIAAAPLMPTAATAMTDAEIEELAEQVVGDWRGYTNANLAKHTIRATIAHLGHGRKAWPSEAELADMACLAQFRGPYGSALHTPYEAALEMARRLREFGA